MNSEEWITLVAVQGTELLGYAFASVRPAPSVYDPGGLTAIVDDFAVTTDDLWGSVGAKLLAIIGRTAAERGASQVVVVCGHRDEAKRVALRASGLDLASEWYVGEVSA